MLEMDARNIAARYMSSSTTVDWIPRVRDTQRKSAIAYLRKGKQKL
jgi:hypothetical protein